ncbi:hypothetical protein BVY04_04300 [bacterium M21]|nr:hypothetical protein BVY04_04300 [bacterium M21]
MKQDGACPKCHSTAVIPDVTVVDFGRSQFAGIMQLAFDRNPDAIVFKDRIRASISAWVCGDCGYIEMYTTTHTELLQAFQERLAYTEIGEKKVPGAPRADCANCGKGLPKRKAKCPSCGHRN